MLTAQPHLQDKRKENQVSWKGYKTGDYGGTCVAFAKKVTGIGGTWGYGGRNLKLSDTPQIGAVLVEQGHVSVIIGIDGNDLILIESNFDRNERITVGRRIEIGNPLIRGFYIPEV